MKKSSFTKWLTTKESFNSYGHYKEWLSILSKEEAKKLIYIITKNISIF